MTPAEERQLFGMIMIHLVFILSGVMPAFMDKIFASTSGRH